MFFICGLALVSCKFGSQWHVKLHWGFLSALLLALYIALHSNFQVNSEFEHPMMVEFGIALAGKRGIICESAYSEFQELVSMCGGQNEKLRAGWLLNHLQYVILLYILARSLNKLCIICVFVFFEETSLHVNLALSCFFTQYVFFLLCLSEFWNISRIMHCR